MHLRVLSAVICAVPSRPIPFHPVPPTRVVGTLRGIRRTGLCLTISTVFYLYIGLNRDNLVAFAVLVGCDYLPQGVQGVGKKKAMELISTVNHSSLLDR